MMYYLRFQLNRYLECLVIHLLVGALQIGHVKTVCTIEHEKRKGNRGDPEI